MSTELNHHLEEIFANTELTKPPFANMEDMFPNNHETDPAGINWAVSTTEHRRLGQLLLWPAPAPSGGFDSRGEHDFS